MINYSLTITGEDAVVSRLLGMPERVMGEVKSSLDIWAKETASYIIESLLSGQVLNRRSGKLSRSTHGQAEASGLVASGVVGAGAGVPYAKIHEYGGLIKAHQVVAKNAQALRIPLPGGEVIFRHSANIPDVQMPERSYIRRGFREKAPDGIQAIKDATLRGILS